MHKCTQKDFVGLTYLLVHVLILSASQDSLSLKIPGFRIDFALILLPTSHFSYGENICSFWEACIYGWSISQVIKSLNPHILLMVQKSGEKTN